MATADAQHLSDYELQRLEHIKRNHEQLVRLGLVAPDANYFGLKDKAPPKTETRPRKKLMPSLPPESLRRSARVQGKEVQYTHEIVDAFGDDDGMGHAKKKAKKKHKIEDGSDDDDDDGDLERAEMLESTTAFLSAARAALLQFVSSRDGEAPSSNDGWRTEAVQRWGELAGGRKRDYKAFVTSRLSTCPPPSPLDLLQEYYCADMWQLLCVCTLMSRCSSWETKHRCISGFFGAFPTPTAFLQQVVHANDVTRLKEIIYSLGLFDDRLRALIAVSEAFLLREDDEFKVDLDRKSPDKIHGVGKFGYESYLLFCRDMGASFTPEDAALRSFANWRKKQPAAAAEEHDGASSSASPP